MRDADKSSGSRPGHQLRRASEQQELVSIQGTAMMVPELIICFIGPDTGRVNEPEMLLASTLRRFVGGKATASGLDPLFLLNLSSSSAMSCDGQIMNQPGPSHSIVACILHSGMQFFVVFVNLQPCCGRYAEISCWVHSTQPRTVEMR